MSFASFDSDSPLSLFYPPTMKTAPARLPARTPQCQGQPQKADQDTIDLQSKSSAEIVNLNILKVLTVFLLVD